MAYVTSTLIQLASQPKVTIKASGLSIGRAVDVSQITIKRMEAAGYSIGDVRIGSETVKSEDGRTRNVSTIEIEIKKPLPREDASGISIAKAERMLGYSPKRSWRDYLDGE